jgi:hypothetical protein
MVLLIIIFFVIIIISSIIIIIAVAFVVSLAAIYHDTFRKQGEDSISVFTPQYIAVPRTSVVSD